MSRPQPRRGNDAPTFGHAGKRRVARQIKDQQCSAQRRCLGVIAQAAVEDALEFLSKLAAETGRVRDQRGSVQEPREPHRLDSGSSRCARAASTWSASLRASAFATVRPWAEIR